MNADLDFSSNCVFIDESIFHVDPRRAFAWSTKGTRMTEKVSNVRAKITTIISIISPYGVVQVSVSLIETLLF